MSKNNRHLPFDVAYRRTYGVDQEIKLWEKKLSVKELVDLIIQGEQVDEQSSSWGDGFSFNRSYRNESFYVLKDSNLSKVMDLFIPQGAKTLNYHGDKYEKFLDNMFSSMAGVNFAAEASCQDIAEHEGDVFTMEDMAYFYLITQKHDGSEMMIYSLSNRNILVEHKEYAQKRQEIPSRRLEIECMRKSTGRGGVMLNTTERKNKHREAVRRNRLNASITLNDYVKMANSGFDLDFEDDWGATQPVKDIRQLL